MNDFENITMVADYDGDMDKLLNREYPQELPLLATRNLMLFPGVIGPIFVGREHTIRLVNKLERTPNAMVAVFCQRNPDIEEPLEDDLYEYGVYANVLRIIDMNMGGRKTLVLQALGRCKMRKIVNVNPYMTVEVDPMPEKLPEYFSKEFLTTVDTMKQDMRALGEVMAADETAEPHNNDALFALGNLNNPIMVINHIATHLNISTDEKALLLEESDPMKRMFGLIKHIDKLRQLVHLKQNIREKTREQLDKEQKNYFLKQQIRNIKKEIAGSGDESPEKHDLIEKAAKKKWSDAIRDNFNKELDKLDLLNTQSPDYSTQLQYLNTYVGLPWEEYTEDDLDIDRAKKILNKNHYGMEKVKERILEYIAVLKLRGDFKSPILCLYGPPGVGKTSLAKSIAAALKRKYVRISLGGLNDEAEIRGHRRTYVGAMPGRIIKNIEKAGTSNPVFVLDEIDKITQNTINGNPSSALLEVLDPEQNNTFHDNYLDVDYDLSKVMFVATANDLSTIPQPLLDRMELIEVSGYTTEEKIEIAKRHLVPKELEHTGMKEWKVKFAKAALEKVIEKYTRESGVRQLEKCINKCLRKLAVEIAKDGALEDNKITVDKLESLMGNPPYNRDIYQGNDYAGVVTGLAWTSVGGEILFIETSLSKGKDVKLTLTGNLGNVMKESAILALEYVKSHASLLDIDYRIFDNYHIHIHVPEGATPKDGPSAGITIATSIASALTQRKVRKNVAMTGEITLRGKVLPVGGIKEKILAAKRAGITDIILCKDNERDIKEIPQDYLKGLTFHYVNDVKEVWDFALTDEKVKNQMTFVFDDVSDSKK